MRVEPDPRRRLTDGVLIRASVLARVLGVRLLTVDTTVVLVPADVQVPATVRHDPVTARAITGAAITAPAPAPAPIPTPTPARRPVTGSRTGGRGLADAVRSLNEGAELLAMSRRRND